MKTSKEYREGALDFLKGNWKQVMGYSALCFGIAFILILFFIFGFATLFALQEEGASMPSKLTITHIANIFSIIVICLATPIWYFIYNKLLALHRNGSPAQINIPISRAVKASLLAYLPPVVIISLTNYFEFIAPGNVAVALLLGVLNLTITILYNVYLFAVLLYPFVAEDNKDKTLWESLKYCMKRTNGYKWKLFCLNFSFFGWVLLAILSFGIGLIWLLPYMIGSFVLFYEDMNKELDSGKTVNPTPTAQNSRNGETSFVYKSAVKREQADGSATPQETAEPTVSQPLNEEQRTERVKKETEDFLEYLKQKNIIVNDGKDSEN